MRGVIDIGSNTVRLSIYKVLQENRIMPMFHNKSFVGLAGYVDDVGMLSSKGIRKAVEVLQEFRSIIDIIQLETIYVFATASLRNVINTEEALKEIEEQTGFDINVISGKEEAVYDYVGASYEHEFRNGLLVDIGGGSTELVSFCNGKIVDAVSFPAGSLNMYTKFVSKSLPSRKEIKKISEYVQGLLGEFPVKLDKKKESLWLCGVGGTARATCKLNNDIYDMPRINRKVSMKSVKKMIEYFEGGSKNALLELVQVIPERTHTILPGMIILQSVATHYHCKKNDRKCIRIT